MAMPNITYIDKYIKDGEKATISAKNLFESYIVGDINNDEHYYRTAFYDFYLKHHAEFESILQWYSIPDTLFYKPKLLSLELYGTVELWLAILRANNMKNITEFHQPIIRVYSPQGFIDLLKIFFKREKKM